MLWTKRGTAAVSTLVLLAACGVQADMPADPTGTEGGPSVTLVGDTAFLELPLGRSADNGELVVAFDAVTEDSRCPTDVQCVWEGNAGIRLTLTMGDESVVSILNSALEPRVTSFFDYVVGYRDLTPYPLSEQPIDRAEYRATITVVDTR